MLLLARLLNKFHSFLVLRVENYCGTDFSLITMRYSIIFFI